MSDARIVCPNAVCRRSLSLPTQLEVMREVHRGGGSYVSLNDPNQAMACPHCATAIRVVDIIAGRHDPKPTSVLKTIGELIVFCVIGLILIAIIGECSR